MNTCPSAEEIKYEISFYFENKENPGVDSIELVRYMSNIPFPEFKKGEKFYISQSDIHPRIEEEIRKNNHEFSKKMIDDLIQQYQSFSHEHWIHKVKIIKVYKSLSNKWQPNGDNQLVYNIEYKLKECFHWPWKRWEYQIKKSLKFYSELIIKKVS